MAYYRAQQEPGDFDAPVEPERLARHQPETAKSVAATLHQFWQEKSPGFKA